MNIVGNIPKQVTYLSQAPRKVGFQWEDDEDSVQTSVVEVLPTFCSDAENKGTLKTGREWSKRGGEVWDRTARKYIKSSGGPSELTRDNTPIKGIKIVSLEVRDKGGRAYKVVTPQGHYFDLREDVLLDAMLFSKIEKGVIHDEFIWAKVGSQMKLVRVGSGLHDALIKADKISKSSAVSAKTLIPGHCYLNKKGETRLYLGRVNTIKVVTKEVPKPGSMWAKDSIFDKLEDANGLQLWLELRSYNMPQTGDKLSKVVKAFRSGQNDDGGSFISVCMALVKDAKVVSESPIVIDIGDDYCDVLKKEVMRRDKGEALDTRIGSVSHVAHWLNMVPAPHAPTIHPAIANSIPSR